MDQAAGADVDVLVVGAGFSGLYLIHRLRALGLHVRGIEKGSDVGGTWYWNRYPGARCDVESVDYSYSFSPELEQQWNWSERYAGQPEILRYLQTVADRFDLKRDIRFDTALVGAQWDGARWRVRTDNGAIIAARFLVMATGCLSCPKEPDIAGLESFAGPVYRTGAWPHEGVDFTGRRVAVIGTGSSAVQAVPEIARQAAALTVFQRTATFVAPANNRPLTDADRAAVKRDYPRRRAHSRASVGGMPFDVGEALAAEAPPQERDAVFAEAWDALPFRLTSSYADLMVDRGANDLVADYARARIRARIDDPAVADRLVPDGYPIGTKRLCLDSGYYEAFNMSHVRLIDAADQPIDRVEPQGVRAGGELVGVDAIVLATGFDAMSGALLAPDITGRAGVSLRDKWRTGPATYLGLMTAGFPNLFMMTGPGSPSVLTNMVMAIEQHGDWLADCLAALDRAGARTIEPTQAAEDEWVAHVNEIASMTLFPQANSWYMGANVPGKPRVFMPYAGGLGVYRDHCAAVAADGYRGFVLDRAAVPA
ncbi:MAG: flavin-containing monooxygenase [Sphingobium sp.]